MSMKPGTPRWSELQPLPARPAWMDHAYCREHNIPTDVFYPAGEDNRSFFVSAAKAVCRQCPVASDCLEWALAHEEWGVWGMTTQMERRRIARSLRRGEPA